MLTEARNTPELSGIDLVALLVILNAEKMYAGGMAAVDYADEVQMASDTAGLKVVGRCEKDVDNTSDGESAEVRRGIFRYANSSTSPVPRSAIGKPCFVEDDATVAGASTNFVAAGIVHDVDSSGVWVDQRPESLELARRLTPVKYVAKTASYTVTAAIAFEGRTVFAMDGNGGAKELTLPTAVAGMKVGLFRSSPTAGNDITVQAATGDTIEASDGACAAGKQIDNTVDAVSGIVWFECFDDKAWQAIVKPNDFTSWVKNDA